MQTVLRSVTSPVKVTNHRKQCILNNGITANGYVALLNPIFRLLILLGPAESSGCLSLGPGNGDSTMGQWVNGSISSRTIS